MWFESSADSLSVVRYVRIEYAQVGVKADRCALGAEQAEVEHCAGAGIVFSEGDGGAVLGCTVRENGLGIRFELANGGEIRGCVVEGNRGNGMDCKTSSRLWRIIWYG